MIDENMVLELLDREVEENQKATHAEYVDMIEKIQGVLTAVEQEKDRLREKNDELSDTIVRQVDKINQLIKDHQSLQHNYDDILAQMDLMNLKNDNIEKEKNEIVVKLEEMRKKHDNTQKEESENTEKRLLEYNIRCEQLTYENKTLQERLSSMISANSSSEDMQSMTNIQLQEVTQKYKALVEENNKNREKLETLLKEKSDLLNVLEVRANEVDDIRRNYKYDLERLHIEHANNLMELTNGHKKERERTVTGLDMHIGPGLFVAHSNLSELMFEDQNRNSSLRYTMDRHSLRDLMKRNSIVYGRPTEEFTMPISTRMLDFPIPEEMDKEVSYLEQLEEKDLEIRKLREQMTEIREKAAKEMKSNPQQEEQIKKLGLEIKHLTEKYDMLVKTNENEKKHAKDTIKELEDAIIETKLKYQADADVRDVTELQLMKRVKLLNYHIKLYEDEINKFNKTSKKK